MFFITKLDKTVYNVTMGFWSDVGCTLGFSSCASEAAPVIQNLSVNLQSVADVTCTPTAEAVQTTTCKIISDKCPNLKVTCSNIATQKLSCDMDSLARNATDALLSSYSTEDLRKALSLGTSATETDIKNTINALINTSCNSTEKVTQTLGSSLVCELSNYVDMEAIARLNETSACAATVALDIAKNTGSTSLPKKNGIIIIVVVVVVYLLFLTLLVLFLRSSGGTPAPPEIVYA